MCSLAGRRKKKGCRVEPRSLDESEVHGALKRSLREIRRSENPKFDSVPGALRASWLQCLEDGSIP